MFNINKKTLFPSSISFYLVGFRCNIHGYSDKKIYTFNVPYLPRYIYHVVVRFFDRTQMASFCWIYVQQLCCGTKWIVHSVQWSQDCVHFQIDRLCHVTISKWLSVENELCQKIKFYLLFYLLFFSWWKKNGRRRRIYSVQI